MDLRKLKKLIDLVQESGIAELEITEGEEKVRISRTGTPGTYAPQPIAGSNIVLPPDVGGSAPAPLAAAGPPEPTGHTLKSPMVGTFYRSPSPGSPTTASSSSPRTPPTGTLPPGSRGIPRERTCASAT